MKMKRTELPAVIAGPNAHGALLGSELHNCRNPSPHCLGDGLFRQAVDDDFEDAADILVELCRHRATERWAIGVIGRRGHGLVF